ncbi:hypothetical protein ACLOJK_028440 [Asimina triloba]
MTVMQRRVAASFLLTDDCRVANLVRSTSSPRCAARETAEAARHRMLCCWRSSDGFSLSSSPSSDPAAMAAATPPSSQVNVAADRSGQSGPINVFASLCRSRNCRSRKTSDALLLAIVRWVFAVVVSFFRSSGNGDDDSSFTGKRCCRSKIWAEGDDGSYRCRRS